MKTPSSAYKILLLPTLYLTDFVLVTMTILQVLSPAMSLLLQGLGTYYSLPGMLSHFCPHTLFQVYSHPSSLTFTYCVSDLSRAPCSPRLAYSLLSSTIPSLFPLEHLIIWFLSS